jgi:hypothetical protein
MDMKKFETLNAIKINITIHHITMQLQYINNGLFSEMGEKRLGRHP